MLIQEVITEIDRRGFLKGLAGLAAGAAVPASAQAPTRPVIDRQSQLRIANQVLPLIIAQLPNIETYHRFHHVLNNIIREVLRNNGMDHTRESYVTVINAAVETHMYRKSTNRTEVKTSELLDIYKQHYLGQQRSATATNSSQPNTTTASQLSPPMQSRLVNRPTDF